MSAVMWTPAEKSLLAHEALKHMHVNHNITRLDALRWAVEEKLPKNRRRVVDKIARFPWFPAALEAAAEEKDKEAQAKAKPVVETPEPQQKEFDIAVRDIRTDQPTGILKTESEPEQQALRRGGRKPGMKVKTVRWSAEERKIVAGAYVEIRHAEPQLTPFAALNMAQRSLPEDRSRPLKSFASEDSWLSPLVAEIEAERAQLEQAEAERREAERKAREAAKEAAQLEARHKAEEARRLADERDAAIERAVTEAIEALSLETLLKMVGQRAAGFAIGALADTLQTSVLAKIAAVQVPQFQQYQQQPAPTVERPRMPPVPDRAKRPKVVVIGTLRQQEEDIKAEFGSALKLEFIRANGEGGSLGDHAKNADMVLSLVDFINHPLDRAARKDAGERYQAINGSVSAVKRWLRAWLNPFTAAA